MGLFYFLGWTHFGKVYIFGGVPTDGGEGGGVGISKNVTDIHFFVPTDLLDLKIP